MNEKNQNDYFVDTQNLNEVTPEEVEAVMSRNEFIKILFTDKRFRFIPNKKAIAKRIRNMNDEEYKDLVYQAFGQLKDKKSK